MKKTVEEYKIQSARIEASATAYAEIIAMIETNRSTGAILTFCKIMMGGLIQQTNILVKEVDEMSKELGIN